MCRWNYLIPFITQVNILLTDLFNDFELQRILFYTILWQINEEPLIGTKFTKFSIQLTLLSYKS